jgi:hypothetical protein
MDLSVGEMMMYGGLGAFAVLFILLVCMISAFKKSRAKLAEKIEKEIDEK